MTQADFDSLADPAVVRGAAEAALKIAEGLLDPDMSLVVHDVLDDEIMTSSLTIDEGERAVLHSLILAQCQELGGDVSPA